MNIRVKNTTPEDIPIGETIVPAGGEASIDKDVLVAYKRSTIVNRHYIRGDLEDIT